MTKREDIAVKALERILSCWQVFGYAEEIQGTAREAIAAIRAAPEEPSPMVGICLELVDSRPGTHCTLRKGHDGKHGFAAPDSHGVDPLSTARERASEIRGCLTHTSAVGTIEQWDKEWQARVEAARAEGKVEGRGDVEEAARFWRKVDENGPVFPMHGRCWVWRGAVSKDYGHFSAGGRMMGAHVYSWQQTNGVQPDGLFILHRCDNPLCVRPSHLFTGTQQENVNDCMAKNRRASTVGERNAKSKLTADDVREIRRRYQPRKNGKLLAEEFGVRVQTIRQAARGDRWAHLTDSEALIAKAGK
jgi:HNH endonuclease